MTEQQTPALEAGDEAIVTPDVAEKPEAAENTKGQVEQAPPAEDKPEGEAKEKSRSQLRNERRKAEMDRLREKAEAATGKLAEAEARLARIESAAKAALPPKEADFADYAEYQAALAAHKSLSMLDARESSRVKEEVDQNKRNLDAITQQQKREAQENWASQVVEAKGRYLDFEQVAFTAPISDAVADIIMQSDSGTDVAYYLGTHRDEAAAISRMSGLDAARAIGRIEARINMPQPKVNTEAPDPISPVKPKASVTRKPENMTPTEYAEWRAKGGTFTL